MARQGERPLGRTADRCRSSAPGPIEPAGSRRPQGAGLQLPAVHDTGPGQSRSLAEAGELRPGPLRAAGPLPRGQAGPEIRQPLQPASSMPNGKTDTNNNGPFSTDHIGANYEYPDGDAATRKRIWQDHVDYTQGFFYFLAHDPRVPKALHAEINSWGLAKDEFTETANWPPQLYVREARRMIGAYVMTQADFAGQPRRSRIRSASAPTTRTRTIASGSLLPDGSALNEGDFQVPVKPYAIPYRSLTPKAEECTNLLVPVCCSASHVAYGTIRMEPVYMILGQASGVAAALACDGNGDGAEAADDNCRQA